MISKALSTVSNDTDLQQKYRSVFRKDMPIFRAAWRNSGSHHEMRIRSSVKKRKSIQHSQPRQEVGARLVAASTDTTLDPHFSLKEEASVVVALPTVASDVFLRANVADIPLDGPTYGPMRAPILSNRAIRLNRGGTFKIANSNTRPSQLKNLLSQKVSSTKPTPELQVSG